MAQPLRLPVPVKRQFSPPYQEQLNIRSYKTSAAPALNAWRHLTGVYQPKDSVSSRRLLQELLETKMIAGEKVNNYLNRCRSLHDQIVKLGSTISEEIFVNIVLQGLGPEWRPCKALLRQQGVISEAALCAALLVEQRDMDQQRPAPRRERERLAFYADNTEEQKPRRLYCKICRNFGHLADRCKNRSRPRQTNPSTWSGRQDARGDVRPAQGYQPPPARNLNPAVQHQQQQPSSTAPVRNVMSNMTMAGESRRRRVRSPSPEPAPHPIGAFTNNNPFSPRHDFTDDDDQDWNLPVPLLESLQYVPDMRVAPLDWLSREQFLKFDTPHIVTPRLALLARDDNKRYNTWYLDSCCGQHMVGSERYISNAIPTPTVTYVTVANNTHLRASAQGIVVLKARGSRTHITLNDVLIVQNLCFNLLSAAQLMDCGVDLSTDRATRDILLHYEARNFPRRQIGRAHSENGVYVLDFDIPDCSGDSHELIDLVPLRFEHIHRRDWKHPDGRPWVPHHPHPRETALHNPNPDGICRDCHTPTTSTSAIAGRGLAAIAEAEHNAPPEEGMSQLELEIATHGVFGTKEHPLIGPPSQHLQGMLRGTGVGTFDALGEPRPYTYEKFLEDYSTQRDPKKKLTVEQEEELARREAEVLRQQSLAEARGTFVCAAWGAEEEASASKKGGGEALEDGEQATPADGETTPEPGPTRAADGAPHLEPAIAAGALPAKNEGGKRKKPRKPKQHLQSFARASTCRSFRKRRKFQLRPHSTFTATTRARFASRTNLVSSTAPSTSRCGTSS
ncbi:unnamed protein product [Closterium sp. Yama58-4]|nr:unnamed protein product [Closterium sp. Yama58-4]